MISNIKNNSNIYGLDSTSEDCKTMLEPTLGSNGNMEYITETEALGEGGSIRTDSVLSSSRRREYLQFLKESFREMKDVIHRIASYQYELDNYEPEEGEGTFVETGFRVSAPYEIDCVAEITDKNF